MEMTQQIRNLNTSQDTVQVNDYVIVYIEISKH